MGRKQQTSSLRPDLARLQVRLDDLPGDAVIIDQHGDAWQKSGYLGYWYRAFSGGGVDSFTLAQRAQVARVVSEGAENPTSAQSVGSLG